MYQILVILKKNFLISHRENDLLKMIIFPFLFSFILFYIKETPQIFEVILFFIPLLRFLLSYLLIIPFCILPLNFVNNIIEDKQTKQKEMQKIAGVRDISYQISWGLTYTIYIVLAWIFFIIPVQSLGYLYNNLIFEWKVLCYILLCLLALMTQCAMFTTMIKNAKIGSQLMLVIYLLGNFSVLLLKTVQQDYIDEYIQYWYYLGIIIFPMQGAILYQLQINDFGLNLQSNALLVNINTMVLITVLIFFGYLLLYIYLDQILPNEYGSHKNWLFCIKRSQIYRSAKVDNSQNNDDGFRSSAKYEDENMIQPVDKIGIEINGLTKKFGSFTAVNKISLRFYKNEIFCLLGHNGAGKTTTLNMLIGMIQKDQGEVTINGLNLDCQLQEIRKITGYCAQQNIVYDNLTVKEVLKFQMDIKNQTQKQQEEIEYLINKCSLQQHQNKIIKNLSGGNKRKVCLALALAGKSQIVFLDEPTSGLDPQSRREIWGILKQIRDDQEHQRVIILTTHYLDEAEELSNKIGIMDRGELLILGSCQYVQKQFGQGYNFSIWNRSDEDLGKEQETEIDNIMKPYIVNKQVKEEDQKNVKSKQFKLPYELKSEFSQIFKQFDEQRYKINLQINTLEDAFINIGLQFNTSHNLELVKPPDSFGKHSNPTFLLQLLAQLQKQFLILFTNFNLMFLLLISITIMVYGVIVANQVTNNIDNPIENPLNSYNWFQFMLVLFFLLSSIFMNMFFQVTQVQEQISNLRYIQNVMGTKIQSYWIARFLFDYIIYNIVIGITLFFTCIVFNKDSMNEYIGQKIFNIQFYISAQISLSYLFSQKLNTIKKIFTWTLPFKMCNCCLMAIIIFVISILTSGVKEKQYEQFGTYSDPDFSLIHIMRYSYYQKVKSYSQYQTDQVEEISTAGQWYWAAILMAGFSILCYLLTFYFDFKKQTLNNTQVQNNLQYVTKEQEIAQEEARVKNCNDPIKVDQISQTFKQSFQALGCLSFGVKKGEIFGLLGPNGAGKSTTFNICTALVSHKVGSVKIGNQEITSNLMDIYHKVGVCPQFDGIWEDLTVYQHLSIYGKSKGQFGQILKENIEYLMTIMSLTQYKNVKAGRLSGGNKRKLCVCISIIGGSDIQFMDEPSTGVDPLSRKYLWNTLKQLTSIRESSILLTTHSMQEAQSLCDRILILVNGYPRCIGTAQELSEKYGKGYYVKFSVDITNHNNVKDLQIAIRSQFPLALQQNTGEAINNQSQTPFNDLLAKLPRSKEINLEEQLCFLCQQKVKVDKNDKYLKGVQFCAHLEICINQARFQQLQQQQQQQQSLQQLQSIQIQQQTVKILNSPSLNKPAEKYNLVYLLYYNDFVFSKTYSFCEFLQQKGLCQDFMISQATLEEIFIQFASYQRT